MSRRRVGPEDIIAINEAYLRIGTYAGAGRETGWSGSTVKRYIIPDYTPKKQQKTVEYEKVELPDDHDRQPLGKWQNILPLSHEEEQKLSEIQDIMQF